MAETTAALNLILHQYDFSSYAEKVRLVLGLKRLAWQAVANPAYAPKPDYTPLTAGYRRTPALQIGADVYCDTRLIVALLEQIAPTPSLYPGPDPAHARARCEALLPWAEAQLFWPVARYITAIHAGRFAPEFHADRALLHRKRQPTTAQVAASARHFLAQIAPQLVWLEDLLVGGQDFVLGNQPSLADFALFEAPWFLETIDGPAQRALRLPRTRAWMERVAAIGHGTCAPLPAAGALAVARAAEPLPCPPSHYLAPEGVVIGEAVTVSPFDQHSPAHGTLAYVDAERITLACTSAATGALAVHFPRLGYRLSRARQ